MKKIVVLIVSSFIFYSCKDKAAFQDSFTFYFENPKPINDSELTSIPNKFIGEYVNSDSVVLKINKNAITSENLFKFKFLKNQMDSLKTEFNFANGKYISKINNAVFDYKMVGDSIEFSSRDIDTIFILSDSQKAKRINGFLILNLKKNQNIGKLLLSI